MVVHEDAICELDSNNFRQSDHDVDWPCSNLEIITYMSRDYQDERCGVGARARGKGRSGHVVYTSHFLRPSHVAS
jgi:hypothetical protein